MERALLIIHPFATVFITSKNNSCDIYYVPKGRYWHRFEAKIDIIGWLSTLAKANRYQVLSEGAYIEILIKCRHSTCHKVVQMIHNVQFKNGLNKNTSSHIEEYLFLPVCWSLNSCIPHTLIDPSFQAQCIKKSITYKNLYHQWALSLWANDTVIN